MIRTLREGAEAGDMLPEISYVPAGVVELRKKQKAGWACIRPQHPKRRAL